MNSIYSQERALEAMNIAREATRAIDSAGDWPTFMHAVALTLSSCASVVSTEQHHGKVSAQDILKVISLAAQELIEAANTNESNSQQPKIIIP